MPVPPDLLEIVHPEDVVGMTTFSRVRFTVVLSQPPHFEVVVRLVLGILELVRGGEPVVDRPEGPVVRHEAAQHAEVFQLTAESSYHRMQF